MKKGFTLIELLVVVLIIGVLSAIALPMYQKAVLKSRFAALMPIVKAMNDSNEAYYLEHGEYASNPQDLPVQGQTEYPTGTTLEFGHNMDYAYVLANNADAKNNYIMYQKHSANYPAEIHCEALEGDENAQAVCVSAGGTQNLGSVLTPGYITYVIEGTGAGLPLGADDGTMSCEKAERMGLTCTLSEDGKSKRICVTIGGTNVCRNKTLNEDGGYTDITCKTYQDRCVANMGISRYDANGNRTLYGYCSSIASDGSCRTYSDLSYYTKDANGNSTSSRSCPSNKINADLSCSAYSSGADYTYDANGKQTSSINCSSIAADGSCSGYSSGTFYTYDAAGNKTSQLSCSSVADNGSCSTYGSGTYYTYNDNGQMMTLRGCTTVAANGNCSEYQSNRTEYAYDANGNQVVSRTCSSVAGDGSCSTYSNAYNYTYDANGNQTSYRGCSDVAADGSCNSYNLVGYYTYDENGHRTSQRYCNSGHISSDGGCTVYDGGSDTTYDENGNLASYRICNSYSSNGNCTSRGNSYFYIIDENGNQMGSGYCSGSRVNVETGACISYDDAFSFAG